MKAHKVLKLLAALLLASTDLALAQESADQKSKGYGKLNSVCSSEEVEAIVSSINKNYGNFRVNTVLYSAEDNCFRLADLSKLKAISKADFDKNGYTDLLVIGMLEKTPLILSLMGSENDKIDMHIITKHFRKRCSTARIISEDGNTLIEYRYFSTHSAFSTNEAMVDSIKLAFRFGGFVEYNSSPKKHSIEKIEYNTDGGVWVSNSGFSITLLSDSMATYDTEGFDKHRDSYSNRYKGLVTNTFNEISGLLNYSDFPNLKDRYAVRWTDAQTGRLKITYDGGKVKIISDYGLLGTYGLNRIYQIMNSLRGNSDWKPESSKALIPLPQGIKAPQIRNK